MESENLENEISNDSMWNAYSLLSNSMTGSGTSSDKRSYTQINNPTNLSEIELTALYDSHSMIQTVVDLYPNDGYTSWIKLNIGEYQNEILKYLEDLSKTVGKISCREAFCMASKLARLYGDAYIIIGANDGLPLDKPVDVKRLKGIEWLQVLNYNELQPDTSKFNPTYIDIIKPDYYRKIDNGVLIHSSRVLAFTGNKLLSNLSMHSGINRNKSVIQSVYESFMNWLQGLSSSSDMISDYDFSILGIAGLSMVTNDNAKALDFILKRAMQWKMGKSTGTLGLYDKDNELPSQLQRRFNGAELILDRLEAYFSYCSKIPRDKLFGITGSSGLTNSVQAAIILKSNWAISLQSWMVNNWKSNLEKIVYYAMSARDTPDTPVLKFDADSIQFPLYLPLTQLEQMELEKMSADKNKILFECGVIDAAVWRKQYYNSNFNPIIDMVEGEVKENLTK